MAGSLGTNTTSACGTTGELTDGPGLGVAEGDAVGVGEVAWDEGVLVGPGEPGDAEGDLTCDGLGVDGAELATGEGELGGLGEDVDADGELDVTGTATKEITELDRC